MALLPSFVKRPFRTKAGSWPTRSDQILPYGAAVCVSNLVAGLEEEVSEDRVTLDYYCHYIHLRIRQKVT
ncbi:hypothetical protein EXIGLDRAFT_498703 [Exidia glandulosa HHB12029]|uniref:Uncharacterized protein n=1 Tax=Exidia glandulosa HHB12029 TaxID=1314781 RepID=A0A165JFR8_EXIGL|nr:hypothetical protein EXIGLDRAFT_498703 [Exidia glandulosa HHB12029]